MFTDARFRFSDHKIANLKLGNPMTVYFWNFKCGNIININSMSGHRVVPSPDTHFYTVTKYAVTALTEATRQELRAMNSQVPSSRFGQLSLIIIIESKLKLGSCKPNITRLCCNGFLWCSKWRWTISRENERDRSNCTQRWEYCRLSDALFEVISKLPSWRYSNATYCSDYIKNECNKLFENWIWSRINFMGAKFRNSKNYF